MRDNNPLHTEPRAARFREVNVVLRGPVNGCVRCDSTQRTSRVSSPEAYRWSGQPRLRVLGEMFFVSSTNKAGGAEKRDRVS